MLAHSRVSRGKLASVNSHSSGASVVDGEGTVALEHDAVDEPVARQGGGGSTNDVGIDHHDSVHLASKLGASSMQGTLTDWSLIREPLEAGTTPRVGAVPTPEDQ